MPVDPMFVLATAAFALGLSLATYRWFAVHNGWPMGEWQAHRPGLPIAIGLFCVLLAMFFATYRGGATTLILPLLGVLCALTWTSLFRVGAQSALLLAPLALVGLLALWFSAATSLKVDFEPEPSRMFPAGQTERDRSIDRVPGGERINGGDRPTERTITFPTDRLPAPAPNLQTPR